jgi:Uma2 family endonuclease
MAAVTVRHEVIGNNLRALLLERLRGKPCRVMGPTLKLDLVGKSRYPDAYIHCGPVSEAETAIRNPTIVFEIAGSSSQADKWAARLQEYQATESIQRCFIIERDRVAASVFARAGRLWAVCDLADGDFLAMPEIGIEIPLAEIYRDTDLPMWSDRGGNAVHVERCLIDEMMAKAKAKGYVTYDELNAALPPDQNSSEQIEEVMAMLFEAKINIIET